MPCETYYFNPSLRSIYFVSWTGCHSFPDQYSVRLAGPGSSSSEGRVEINYAGRWGTVCGDRWNNINAGVVCKQLGFAGPSTANVGQYGTGSGIIWLNNVNCDASDYTLASCYHSAWGISNCDHSQDAGVVCSSTNETGLYEWKFRSGTTCVNKEALSLL